MRCFLGLRAGFLRKLNADLERLSSRMVTAQDNEQRRIARELHDSLGQELCAAQIILDHTFGKDLDPIKRQAAAELKGILDRTQQQVRTVSYLLHPPSLDMLGLYWALNTHLDGLAKRSGVEINTRIESSFPRLPPAIEIAIFRVIQEAVTNTLRHSGATKMWVTLERSHDRIVGTVRDEGKGISEKVASFHHASIGVGIGGMKQRIEELGGQLTVQNANPGALVRFDIPAPPALTIATNPEDLN